LLSFFHFFITRPPFFPLFPYTTLFRSHVVVLFFFQYAANSLFSNFLFNTFSRVPLYCSLFPTSLFSLSQSVISGLEVIKFCILTLYLNNSSSSSLNSRK